MIDFQFHLLLEKDEAQDYAQEQAFITLSDTNFSLWVGLSLHDGFKFGVLTVRKLIYSS
jgi:hypothetical protein